MIQKKQNRPKMRPKQFYHLIVVVQTSLVFAKTYPNYGYYDPFPPKNQVLYNFSPLSDTHENILYTKDNEHSKTQNHESYDRRKHNRNTFNTYHTIEDTNKTPDSKFAKDRSTRDLTWRQFDVFLRGDVEPSCAELRQMWNLARKIQKQDSKENKKQPLSHPFSFNHNKLGKNIHLKKQGKGANDRDINSVSDTTDKKLAPTHNIDLKNTSGVVLLELNNNKNIIEVMSPQPSEHNSSSMHSRGLNHTRSSSSSFDEGVYGVVKTHHVPVSTPSTPAINIPSPTSRYNTIRVRDPAKEIFGMFRQRSKSLRNRHSKQQQQQNGGNSRKHHYGKIHLQTSNNHPRKSSSYLDLLQRKLYGPTKDDESSNNEVYGVVQQYPSSSRSRSSYEKVRDILADQRGSLGYKDDLQLSPGESAFDRIRERLMKTRARDRLNMPKSYLRRLRSRKRRQNVSTLGMFFYQFF